MFIYLASPYSAATPEEREQRFHQVCKKAAELMLYGHQVFCPIAHSHPIEVHGMEGIQPGEFWLKQDFAILKNCEIMYVYCLEGWEKSKGIIEEAKFCAAHNIPVMYMMPSGRIHGKALHAVK